MPYERILFASLALFYCLALGLFSFLQQPRTRLHTLFACYNFSLALYNSADAAVLFSDYSTSLWIVRMSTIGASLMAPFFLWFCYELIGISHEPVAARVIKFGKIFISLTLPLHFTPLIIKDIRINQAVGEYLPFEIPGVLFWPFMIMLVGFLLMSIYPIPKLLKNASKLQKTQFSYVVLSCGVGITAMLSYLVSFFWKDLPWLYYSLEVGTSLVFSYAIFQHQLLSIYVTLRRVSLLIGIYVTIGLMLLSLLLFTQPQLTRNNTSGIITIIFICGLLFSAGSWIYSRLVKHYEFFQEEAASHMIHELKSPLSAIQSAQEILKEEMGKPHPDTAKIQTYLSMIERNSSRLDRFVHGFLDVSKADMSQSQPHKTPVDLASILDDVLAHFPNAHHRLKKDIQGPVLLNGNDDGLRQILTNLLSNALKYDPQGEISIKLNQDQGYVRLSVSDQGRGLKKEDITRIFEPFQCGTPQEEDKKGTGLGLVIAKRWTEAHGGKIWVESAGPGQGATFHVVLPAG